MEPNPYESPTADRQARKNRPGRWGRTALIGLAIALASAVTLFATAEFHQMSVSFRLGALALGSMGAFCVGTIIMAVGALGWLVSRRS